jgi:REP element-mobilizing transposase RayT
MSERFKEKYRIPSARLQNWDYGWNGIYFITICVAGREHYFGEITKGKIRMSEIGLLAERFWFEIPQHFPFILLDAFVVMPNHIHGILIIDKVDGGRINTNIMKSVETRQCLVSEHCDNSGFNIETRQCLVSTDATPGQQRFRNPGKNNISSVIGSYKSVVARYAHRIISGFDWQAKFHDHIVRSDDSLKRIREYIQNNPANWRQDKFFN